MWNLACTTPPPDTNTNDNYQSNVNDVGKEPNGDQQSTNDNNNSSSDNGELTPTENDKDDDSTT